jgi:6-pyruvoyltetrahydropterin/6-carboxytetrahydropterin synthase
MTLTLETKWSSAHFYQNPAWTAEKNRSVFGRCFTPHGHGHDYKLEISFETAEQEEASDLEPQLRTIIFGLRETLDHQHLNFAIPEFKEKVPTTENLALYCYSKIQEQLTLSRLAIEIEQLRLYERPDLWVELSRQ